MMDIPSLYQVYVEAGQQPCTPDDPRRGEKLYKYRIAKQHLFEALKAEYHAGRLRSDRADKLTKVISESSQNPEAFWGSAKTASSNQAIFVHEKNERLFEELLRCWKVLRRNLNMKKIIAMLLVLVMCLTLFVGCDRQSDRVSYNISQQADNFNVTRRLAVINARSDEPIFELIGNFALENSAYNELEIIVEVSPGVYKKHYVYLNEWTIYVVEDVSGAYVDPYHYEVNFLPEMIIPVTFISED